MSFNPHPPLRAGATFSRVCFLSPRRYQVSILTHPCGRVQLALLVEPTGCFNPHPPLRAGATPIHMITCSPPYPSVSILTHPCGRVQRSCNLYGRLWTSFNPTPLRSCNVDIDPRKRGRASFNPHPPLRAGATIGRPTCRQRWSFNPHPPFGRVHLSVASRGGLRVSILTHPCGRVQPQRASRVGILTHPCGAVTSVPDAPVGEFQSSPTLAGGCKARPVHVSILTHPPGATTPN